MEKLFKLPFLCHEITYLFSDIRIKETQEIIKAMARIKVIHKKNDTDNASTNYLQGGLLI